MNIILFGPPGAGKGTQSNNIINDFNLIQVSTGDLLRNEVKLQTELGKKIELIINKGDLVSDKLVSKLIEKIISVPKNSDRFIFDGYPRTTTQIHDLEILLDKFKQKISVVLNLHVNIETISKRITGRITCDKCLKVFNIYSNPPSSKNHECEKIYIKKRTDDNLETVFHMFQNYKNKTKPVLDYYRKNGAKIKS